MKFGIFFDFQRPRPWDADEGRYFREAIEQARLADDIGIAHLWAQEHHFLEEYSHSSAPEVFLGACSQVTRRIRLGHGISLMLPKYNHPARVVERIATLDLLSGGRVEWGTGESSSRIELEGFGVDYVEKRAMWAEATREAARMFASSAYPGFSGRYFSMPPRNVVPKPAQRPHPPLWVACSNRETVRLAARLGIGALTFAFMDHREARFWVEEYYSTLQRECVPIGLAVNPHIAMLCGFMCHPDGATARRVGVPGLRFFAYGLSHYFRTGVHRPGQTDLWERFQAAPEQPLAGVGGIGSPNEIRETMLAFEEAGVDQVILLHQCGQYRHEEIMPSLELFGRDVLPEFAARHAASEARKLDSLSAALEHARARIEPVQTLTSAPEVEAYPATLERQSRVTEQVGPSRSLDAAALWRLHAGEQSKDHSG